MSFKVRTPPMLNEEQIMDRIRQYQIEKENGLLLHFENVKQLKEHLATITPDEA